MITAISYGGVRVEFEGGVEGVVGANAAGEFVSGFLGSTMQHVRELGGRVGDISAAGDVGGSGGGGVVYRGRVADFLGGASRGGGSAGIEESGNGASGLGVVDVESFRCVAGVAEVRDEGTAGRRGVGCDGSFRDASGSVVSAGSGVGVEAQGTGSGGTRGNGVVGDGEAAVSERTAANRVKRARAKERKLRKQAVQGRGARGEGVVPEWRRGAGSENVEKKRGFFAESTPDMRYALRMSRGERLIAENDLKAFQARRRLELEKDKDVSALKKLNEAQLLRRTETNKVQIEKAYASLAATGNVPGVGGSVAGGGSVETVVSGSSNSYLTISPGSSVSMKEVHEMQKENLRLKKREEDFVRRERELIGKLKACGIDVPAVSSGSVKTSWTVDKYGDLLEKYRGNPAVPEGLVMDIDCRMRLDPDGKVEERVAKYYEEMSDQVSEIVMY